ncbi:hypothetical protein V8D89_012840 [Ganoderma adspersum]
MSDSNTNPLLDSGSNTNPTDSTSTTPSDPNAGIPADPNVGSVGQQTATLQLSAAPPASSTHTLANPDSSLGSDSSNSTHVAGFTNQSASYRNTIIIASAVSGAIGLILVSFVIWIVYRRRNKRKTSGGSSSGNAGRPTSDSSWVGPRLNPGDSFNDGKLEAGDRGSKADSVESDTTLNGDAATHKKSSSFGTSTTYSPRPSMDKLRITTTPLVSRDPFQAPQMSVMPGPHPSVEQLASQGLLTPLSPRVRRGPALRVESSGNFNSSITVEQANPSPDIPLVTPVDTWRSPITDLSGNPFTLMPPPARRDSMASLSRQSSRASSRNSPVEGNEVTSPRKKAVFSTNAKKRRHSRADSIDPFRKSAASTKVRRKSIRSSRTDVLASRGASYNTGGVVRRRSNRSSRASRVEPGSVPSTPGGRRRSRAPSVMSSRSQSQSTVNETRIFSRPLAPSVRGLPSDPRPPSSLSARRFESPPEAFTFTSIPRTPGSAALPISRPGAPRTAPIHTPDPRTPRTPGGHARRPKADLPRTPTSLEDAHWRAVPLPETPMTAQLATPRPLPVPATPAPKTPLSANVSVALSRPRTPQSAMLAHPRPRTPQSASAGVAVSHPRTPQGAAHSRPRTPQVPSAMPQPQSQPPKTLRTPGTLRAELRLSQLSRTLSEVSRESDYSNMGKAF